ncbi:nesprin-2a isoform X5 [Paralichthys olivaceus]|uniref:nesprin-2a isoform X5 n=1 Tax=Paralichthys olivaceus TaxID=8255 RepID=UPI00375251E8
MASGGAEEDDGGIPLDIDNVHMLLQVEHEQIQRRTFTNWINAQLAKRRPPSFVSDLFSDLGDGSKLLDLLEVMSGQSLKRQRGHGVFQQRANIETALDFLKKKSIKLVNIHVPDIIDGRPSIILGLVWTIILHCHIEELASALSFSSRHSSLDSLTSLDSWSGSPVPASPVPASPLHRRFRVSAKKALLMWVRDQCQRVGSSVRVKDFKSSWKSGEAFLVILCSLRPQLVDLSLVPSRSNLENLEEAFHVAERELHIPRLLEPQDVNVKDPDEKSIMTYVAQFLQYSNDMPARDDHLELFPLDQPSCFSPLSFPAHFTPAAAVSPLRQVSPCERAQEVTRWLQQTFQELSESWTATENSGYAEKYQVFQRFTGSVTEQRRPVLTLLATIRRCPELSGELHDLRAAWDRLEEELQRCKADLDLSLPPPLDSVVVWLQGAEAALTEEGGRVKDHADAAKEARAQQDALKTLIKEMSRYVNILDEYHNVDASGNLAVPLEKFDEMKRRLTHIRVSTKYHGIKLEYQECRHTALDLLNRLKAKVQTWKTSYRSEEAVHGLLQDWHETVERQGTSLILMDALQNLKEKANAYTSKAALGEDSQLVHRQVKEAESEADSVEQAVAAVRGTMERVLSAWETYDKSLVSLQTWLAQTTHTPAAGTQDMSEWTSCHAKLNEVGNFLIEVTETSTSHTLAGQLSTVNKQWAGCMKRTKFEIPGKLSSPGFQEHVGEPVHQTQRQPETGMFLVARTARANQPEKVKLQTQDPSQLSPQIPSHTLQQSDGKGWRKNQHGTTIVVPLFEIQTLPQPVREPVTHIHPPLVIEAEFRSTTQSKSFYESQASSPSQNVGPMPQRRLVLSTHVTSSGTEDNESSSHSQIHKRAQPNFQQLTKTSPRPPVMVPGEVHLRAQSMARSRMEKARVNLQGRIQQAIKLFGSKEISESQAKKKQRALKILQPVALEEFLNAVEGFGAFCSGPQLQDLMLLSDSVRKQWEDVRRDMAALVPVLRSQIREGKQSFSVVQTDTNTLHEATDQTDHVCLHQQQVVVDGAPSVDERVESLRDLCETVTPGQSSCLATYQQKESEETQETRPSDTVFPALSRGQQLWANTPLRETGTSADSQPSSDLPRRRSADAPQRDLSPVDGSVPHRGDTRPLPSQDVPTEGTDRQHRGSESEGRNQKSALGAKEQLLNVRLLHMTESNQQTHIQAVVRSDTVETKQAAEWTVIPETGTVAVTCQDVVTSFTEHTVDVEKKKQLMRDEPGESKDEIGLTGEEPMQRNEEFTPVAICPTKTWDDSPLWGGTQEEEHPTPRGAEEESGSEAKRSKLDGEKETDVQREEGAQMWRYEEQRRRGSCVKKEEEEKKNLVQRRASLLGALREIKGEAEHLRLREPTLPALQQRTRVLTELESRVVGLLSELRHVQDVSQSSEVDDVWEEATKAVTERLQQCRVLTELLKRFQSIRAELSGTLQRAENSISEQASYMGKENLLRLNSKVQETKSELNSLGGDIEEVRSVCRQIHTHLRQMPECNFIPFESEADALMDSWLDISERTDSHLENLHLCLTLWDGVLQLGAEVEKWTANKLTAFAQCPCFQSEDDIKTLQNEILAQEKSVERFHRRTTEIQSVLQSTEPPLELQVVETQMRKKLEQLEELVIEAEDVYRQTVAAKGQITARMSDCCKSLQKIQDSLLTLGGSDVAAVLANLKDLCLQLQTQDEQAESLLEDLSILTSVSSPDVLQSLSAEVMQLQEEVRNSHQLFSEVEEQTQRNIQDLDRLQREREHLEQWLQVAEETAAKEEDLGLLQEEALQIRGRTELLSQLVSSLQSSNLQQSALVHESSKLLERCNFHSNRLHGTEEKHRSLSREAFQGLSESTQSSVGDLVHAPLGESSGVRCPVEQRLQRAQDACCRLEERRSNDEHFGHLLQDCHFRLTSLQNRMSACQAQKESSAGLVTNAPALEVLPQEVTDLEKDILQLEMLNDATTDSSAVEDQASNLQNHKRALDSNQRVPQVKEEVSCVQAALKDLAENVGKLFVNHEMFPDTIQLKQQWSTIQDFDSSLSSWAARAHSLQNIGESSVTQERLPADVILTIDGVVKDLNSLRSIFLQQKQECAENIAGRVREVIRQLQHWSQTVQAEPPPPSQAALDEGSQLQQYLLDVLSEKHFLLNCFGTKVWTELEKITSNALSESTCALAVLSKSPVSQGHGGVELDGRETVGENCKSNTPHSADSSDETCPPECPSPSATDNSESEQNDNKIITTGDFCTLEKHHPSPELDRNTTEEAAATRDDETYISTSSIPTAKQDALVSNQVENPKIPEVVKAELQQESPEIDSITDLRPNDEIDNIDIGTISGNFTEPSISDSLHQENPEPLQQHSAWILDSKVSATGTDETENINSPHCDTSVAERHNDFFSSATEIVAGCLAAQSNTFMGITAPQEQEKPCEDSTVKPEKDFTTMLDMEPHDVKEYEKAGVSSSDVLGYSQGAEDSSEAFPEKKSDPATTIIIPDNTDLKNLHLAAQSVIDHQSAQTFNHAHVEEDINASPNKVLTIVLDVHPDKQQGGNLETSRFSQGAEPCGSRFTEKKSEQLSTLISLKAVKTDLRGHYLKRPKSNVCQVADSLLENPFTLMSTELDQVQPDVNEEVTDLCHAARQMLSSCTVEGSVADTHIPAGDTEQTMGADTAESAGKGRAESAEGENTEEASEGPESKRSEVPESESKLKDKVLTQGQPQMQGRMEPARTEPGLSADLGPAGESMASHKPRSTMQDILSEIQSLVERSNIINRTPHTDLNWYLKSSPGEPEIRLVRTVQRVLACRYQPAQLDVTAMVKQLEEAEEHRACVQERVATMKNTSAASDWDPIALKRAEGQWSAALLDASATVQVKAAQLDQVKQYHKQMKMLRAFLEVLADEKEKMSLNALGSSAIQADKLHALLQTMEQKKGLMRELLHLSSQLSVHLSDAESSGALLAQLANVQEEWSVLKGSIKRALRHATNATSQSSLLRKEAEQMKTQLEDLQKSNFQSNDSKSALELVCLTTDLKLYNQLYLHLQSQSDALVHFSLGQKEKDEIQNNLQELGSLLDVTKRKLDNSTCCISSGKINKQLQDLVIWAKQAENHISTGKKLALFPEEARIQITDMKKFQTDILSRRSKMQAKVEEMKDIASDMEKEESDQVLKTIEDLYEAISDSLDHVLDTMKKHLHNREKLLSQLDSMEAWLAQSHAAGDACVHVENLSKVDVQMLESELESHRLATVEIQSQLNLVEAMAESCEDIAAGLSPEESRYLVNRLSGLCTELDGLLSHEKATSWELEELIHERTSSDEELSTIQTSLKQISSDLEQQKFPLTLETLSTVAHLMHMLIESQCQVQELQHCQEAKRSALLYTIGELLDRCKTLSLNTFEQDKYLHLRRQMEESRDIAKEQILRARDKSLSMGERFRLYQMLLVELPLVKTQCQEAGDQLEAIAQELYPSELDSERQRIHHTVETLVSWELSATDDIKYLEAKLLPGLRFSSELPALIEFFQRTRAELEGAEPVSPDEKAIDGALRRHWVIWRNLKSGMRVLEALGRREKISLKNNKELYPLRDAAMQECHIGMESLSQARESLKDYQWAAQGAIAFLHNAEAMFLSAPGGFLDCTEEQRQTQQALEALEDGFQAHMCHLVELLPRQPCLSHPEVEQLHISLLSQLLVGRAVLEAQAQLRLESLQRCAVRQQSHGICHEDIRQHLSGFEARLSDCATVQVTSNDKCVAQQHKATLLLEDLRSLGGKIEELRAGCPMQGCGVGKDGELGALWRRWVSLRRGVGLLMVQAEQKQEEWKDITTSIQQCCSFLASLQAEVPDSSTVSFTQEKPQELLARAEIHQAGLEQEQQALASLEHRLEHALSLSNSQHPISPGPVGKTLAKIQENVRSLKERNLLVVAAAQAEENERQHVQDEIEEVEKHVFAILPKLEACSNQRQQQELTEDLSTQTDKLRRIMDGLQSWYTEIPADISKRLQDVQQSLQRAEEELMEGRYPVRKLAGQVAELGSGLEKVKVLLEQRSPTVPEAQNVLKHVWDELDAWHSRLMLLESEVQDLAEEQPHQAHLLIDHITQPLQLYQNASQMAENRTSFLSKIPACLQEFEDISYSATCWLDEAQSWLSAPCSFTSARGLQNHAKSLQLVLDDSERIRDTLQDFRPVLAEISAVCDISAQEERLDQNDQRVLKMQRNLLKPLEQLLQSAVVVEEMETELKTMEKNVPKIRTILSSMDDTNITLTEHLHNRQVIQANVQSIRRTLEEIQRYKGELLLPQGAKESLLVFSRARLLLQPLEELEHLSQYQTSLLKNKIREEEATRKDLSITSLSKIPEETQQLVQQEPSDVSNSEEEEDEDDESCHSSSSDTLTCSVPEDPEDTLVPSDVKSEDIADTLLNFKELKSLAPRFSSQVETTSKAAESEHSSVTSGCDTNDFAPKNYETGLTTMDSKADSSRPDTLTAAPLIAAVSPATEDQYAAADTLERHESPKHETFAPDPHAKSPQAEDTRTIPARPVTPFTATRESPEFTEDEDKDLTLSTAPHRDEDALHHLKEQSEVGSSHCSLEESQQAQDSSKEPLSSAEHEEDEKEQQRWSRLYTEISERLATLRKLQEERQTPDDGGVHETVPEKKLISTGSAPAVLQRIQESVAMLRQIARSADGSQPDVKERTYEALRRVLLCLDTWTNPLLTADGAGENEPQLRMLQQECVSSELLTVAELLRKIESEPGPLLSTEEPEASQCLTCLQDCLSTVQLLFTSSDNQLAEHLGLKNQHQLCILDEFELGQSVTFPGLKDAPCVEQCILGRHLRESPWEKAKLQQASRALLQGITHLLELGEESIKEKQMSQVHNRSQLQAILCRHKKLLPVLGSQLAFVQHLFQREPEVLRCQEDERLQLEVRAKALQQQAQGREVASQKRLQEWTLWEDNCDRVGRVLDESEALISSGEPEEDDEEEESVVQHRLDACQQTLVQLDESRAALGILLDQCEVLQKEPAFAASVGQTGGALELRWRRAVRRTEQEIQRCRDIQVIRARFQIDFTTLSNWLVGAKTQLKSWSDLAETSDLKQEFVHHSLIKLLDFSKEAEAMSVQRTSVSRDATRLLHLSEADCPGLRAQIAQLEVNWSQFTSDLPRIQDQLQQLLLAAWPPVELLSDLESWLKKQDSLNQENEKNLKVKDASQITEVLQHHRELKAGVVGGQLILDFLSQSRPQAVGAHVQALQSERTVFAEKLGALRLQWLHLQGELQSQIHGAEQMHHTCAVRERQLQQLHRWILQKKKQLSQWEQPTSQTLARKALREWEAVAGRAKEKAAALQKLKTKRVDAEKEEKHPCDIAFSKQAESVSQACEDLSQQMEALKPALQRTVAQWSCFDRDLREVTLHAGEVRCALQHQPAPLFSLKQAEEHMDVLQELQGKVEKGEELWAAVEMSFQGLVKNLHCGAAQALGDQVEGEKKRWESLIQELKDEHVKTGETVSLWQEYRRLFGDCSLHMQHLRCQWEELLTSSPSPEQDTKTTVHSVEKMQDISKNMQRSAADVLKASEPLIGRLHPLAANLIKSETKHLIWIDLLLSGATSVKRICLQEDLKKQEQFHTCLQTLEQTRSIKDKVNAGLKDKGSAEVLSELSDLFPLLVDVREMSHYLTLNDQDTDRLHVLSREWIESTTCTSDMNRELQAERQSSQTFQEKCDNLTHIKEKLVEELMFVELESLSSLREILTVHQRLQAEIITGHQLLQSLLCDTVKTMDKETGGKRDELIAQVTSLKESWFGAIALVGQRRSWVKEQLRLRSIYQLGLKILSKLLMEVDPLLPLLGAPPISCVDCQCAGEALDLHSPVYNQMLEAGRRLCENMSEFPCRRNFHSELQSVEGNWDRTNTLQKRNQDLLNTTAQKWSQCQDRITGIMSELEEVKTRMKQQLPETPEESEREKLIQGTELSLQCLTSGLRELGTMKTDLSQYITAGDSTLLEQQLEQLHGQWEELCMKVSLHKQEIADRLNAWTIFNDKNKEFCDWLTQMENKVCHNSDLSIEEMVEKLKKDCMEEINLFSENKSHLKQLGEQLLLASDEAKQTQVHGSLQEVNQRWHNLFHHIEARVKKLRETLVTVQQLDKNMSNLRSWLSRIEAELSRPITYSVCHHQEIQRRLAEQQELQRDIEQHTEGVASVLSLCDVLLRDEDAAGATEAESDSLQETSRSLDQRWRTICAMAVDRRLRIEETWRLWCKFLDDYSRFEDWLKMAERTAANPNSAGVLYTAAKEELKKFEGFQRQVHERLTQLEIVNNQYRRLARENRTDRASQLKAMVHEGNRRWDTLYRRVAAVLRRLKYFTSQREDFEGTRESMLVWLTELDLQLTNVEHFSESDVHHKIQQLNSFQKEISLNTERIDGLIVFGEGLIQKSSPQDAALIEDELEELHTYCQEVFSRLVRFHQRLSQPPIIKEEPELSGSSFYLESSLELIGRPWLGRSLGSLPATPTHLLASSLERSGRETPASVDSLPLEWDHTGDVGGSSSHEDDDEEEEEEQDEEGVYFSALSVPSRSVVVHQSPVWGSCTDTETQTLQLHPDTEAAPALTSTPVKRGFLGLMSQCSGSIEDIKRVSLILDDEDQPVELGLTGLTAPDKQSGVIERWELLQARSRSDRHAGSQEPQQLGSDLDDLTSWLENTIPELDRLQLSKSAASIADMEARARELREMQRMFTHYKSIMLSVNLRAQEAPELQQRLLDMNRDWSRVSTVLQRWDSGLKKTLMRCQEFHETLHSLLLWLAHAESRRYTVDISDPDTSVRALQQHRYTLADLQEELRGRQTQQASLQALWSQLKPEDGGEDGSGEDGSGEAQEKLHVTGSKLKLLLKDVDQDLSILQQRLNCESASEIQGQSVAADVSQEAANSKEGSSTPREKRESPPPRSFFYRVLRAAFPLHLLLLLLLLLPCLIPLSEGSSSCTVSNNFARSFYPMLHYTNGPPPT